MGRRAYTAGAIAEDTGVKLDERGRVVVDEHCWTGVDGVWAVGDCVRGPMLAHKGFEEGIAVEFSTEQTPESIEQNLN